MPPSAAIATKDALHRTKGYARVEQEFYSGQAKSREGRYIQAKAISDLYDLVPHWPDVRVRGVMRDWNGGAAPGTLDTWSLMGDLYKKYPKQAFWMALAWGTLSQLGTVRPRNRQAVMDHVCGVRKKAMGGRCKEPSGHVERGSVREFLADIPDPAADRLAYSGRDGGAKGQYRKLQSKTISSLGAGLDEQFENGAKELLLDTVPPDVREHLIDEYGWKPAKKAKAG